MEGKGETSYEGRRVASKNGQKDERERCRRKEEKNVKKKDVMLAGS